MQILYKLEENDIIAFFDYSLKRNSVVKKTNIFNYAFIAAVSYWQIIYAILFNDFLSNFNWIQFNTYLIIGSITFVFVLSCSKLFTYFLNRLVKSSTAKKHKQGDGVLGEHLIRLKENHLIETSDVNETQQSWKGVDRIEENNDYIFIYTTPLNAHIIPKRFFKSQADAVIFYEEAQRLKSAAKLNYSPSYLASAD